MDKLTGKNPVSEKTPEQPDQMKRACRHVGKTTKQKVVNNFLEFWNDTRSVYGKPPANRELRRFLKAKTGSQVWNMFSSSPGDVQSLAHYSDTPVELRRKRLETNSAIFMAILHDQVLRLIYLSLWYMSNGINLVEIKEWLEQSIGNEFSEVMFEEMTKQPGTNGMIKFGTDTLGLTPGSIAGANARLKDILIQCTIKEDEGKSEYEQDLSIGLWECSEGAHLDEFTKKLSSNGALTEVIVNLHRIFQEKNNQALRGIVLGILRKTIEGLPDIADVVKDRRAQKESGRSIIRDESDINDDEPLFDNIADKDEESIEEVFEHREQIAEWRNKTQQFTTRELELYQSELSRLEADKTREEYYGNPNRAKSITQQFKYMKSKYSK